MYGIYLKIIYKVSSIQPGTGLRGVFLLAKPHKTVRLLENYDTIKISQRQSKQHFINNRPTQAQNTMWSDIAE
jgi:hypothetical protein